ncbi:scarecrow-like protein 33 [Humulus lupulus]|uniref:scarecrow-like protein 33 n=1 Tax=Humulus lupulus TaxID=3486 RepID=UPI002B400F75|nr:scarecrow-like protein 33 [Humulus lupulus]
MMSTFPPDQEEAPLLNCISKILLEEDMEEGTYFFSDATVEAAQRPFSDALAEKNSSERRLISAPRSYASRQHINLVHNNTTTTPNYSSDHCFNVDQPFLLNDVFSSTIHEPYCSYNSIIPALPVINYNFQPSSSTTPRHADKMVFDFEGDNPMIPLKLMKEIPSKGKSQYNHLNGGLLMKRKSVNQLEIETLAGRKDKQLTVYSDHESELYAETFDMVLLANGWQNGLETSRRRESKVSNNSNYIAKTRRRKWAGGEEDLLDLRNLLTHCAEAVAVNDRETATELLLQIRRNSSFSGNGSQRLAHYFGNALEARLNGIGNDLYTALAAKRMSVLTSLKSCRLFLSACPLIKLSNFFINHTILELAEKANTLHIIHFGILNGFQWPSLIQRLSMKSGGPPLLRITGIDLPLPGFRPVARLEETGDRLAYYCKRFNVPFTYKPIAQAWENITCEDLNINKDDITVVNSLYLFRYLLDDTAGLHSSRDAVLKLVKRTHPDIFIHGIVNGAYNAPFFTTRFREALYYFSTVFDMLEANSPQEFEQDRKVYEQECYGKEILNVVACEGSKRVERPETYKQWHARNLRAGLKQLPLSREIMKKVEQMKASCYHKDFLVDEDSQWMLQGWKGRVLYALSCWKPD